MSRSLALLLLSGLLCLVCILLTACGGGGSTPPPPAPPDFAFAITPPNIALVPGTSISIQAGITPKNGFSAPVTLTSGTLPTGVSLSPSLPQTVGSAGLTLTVSATSNTVVNSYSIQLTAVGGSEQHSATEALTVAARASFALSAPTQTVNLTQGTATQAQISVTPGSGIVDYTVSLQASSSAPAGISPSFSSTTISPPGSSTLTLSTAINAVPGPGTVTITATRSIDNQLVTASFPVYVNPQPGTIPGNRTTWVRFGSNPVAAYYDATRNHVLASLPAINQIEVVDAATGNLLSSIPVSVANFEPNGVWLASSSNLSGSLDGNSLFVLGAGHVATVDLALGQVVKQQATPQAILVGRTAPTPIAPTFLTVAQNGHMVFGSWGDSSFYHWDGIGALASQHSISDLYSFDRNFDGSKVLIISGDSGANYQLLDVASDTITVQGNYTNAVLMTVRGNPVRQEWAVANSNGIDFLDGNLNLIARVPAFFVGSLSYWGMTYSPDGKYLYFLYSPTGLPFLFTVDTSIHQVVNVAPATGTDLAYYLREPPEWISQPFASDTTGLVFGLGEKGLAIDDATYAIDPSQATPSDYAIIATPDNGPVGASTQVQITTQAYSAQPDIWFGSQRASSESLNGAGQVIATAPAAQNTGPVNIKLFPANGYAHIMPQAFTYGTIITSVRDSMCAVSGGCSTDVFGFGLFGSDTSQTTVTIGGNPAAVRSANYFNTTEAYPYPLQFLTVTVPSGVAGRADVSVKTAVGQATLPAGFLYASSLQSYPSATPYNALLFDEKRDVLYASTQSQIVRFAPTSSTFLTPITPPSLTGQNQLQAMALTPDGSLLIVANQMDNSVALIDPDNPATAQAVPLPTTVYTGGPVSVAATSTNKVLISMSGSSGPLFELDLSTLQVVALTINGLYTGEGPELSATSDGSTILFRGYPGVTGFWNDASQQFLFASPNFYGANVASAAGDGNLFAVGAGTINSDGTSNISGSIPDELGGFQSWNPSDAALNDSGSLEFAPGESSLTSPSGLFVLDTHHGKVLRNIVLPNLITSTSKSIALDAAAQHVFIADSQGLTVLTLQEAPLAIGWLNPGVVSTNGSSSVILRGSGFQVGTTVTIGGKAASAVYIDVNTLQLTVPANPAGGAQVVVQNPGGESYTLDMGLVYQ